MPEKGQGAKIDKDKQTNTDPCKPSKPSSLNRSRYFPRWIGPRHQLAFLHGLANQHDGKRRLLRTDRANATHCHTSRKAPMPSVEINF